MKPSHYIIAVLFLIILITSYSYADEWIKTSNAPPGITQFKLATGIENGNDVQFLLAGGGQGLFRSTDNGATFENIGLEGIGITAFVDSKFSMQDGEYIVSASDGIHKSTDGGSSWQHYTTGIEGFFITDVIELAIETPIGVGLCAGTAGQGVFTSSDGGQTWGQMGTGLENKTVKSLDYFTFTSGPFPEGLLFATTQENGVYRFDFSTNTWLSANDGNGNLVGTTAIAGDSQGNLFLASSPNIYSSPNDPVNWQFEVIFDFANSFAVTKDDKVFVSSLGDGIKLRISEGVWVDFSAGIPVDPEGYKDVGNITYPQGTGQYLWAAYTPLHPSMTPGIYRTLNPVTDVDEYKMDKPENFRLVQNYPNPFNPATKIRYSVPGVSVVVIKVFDILGSEIETLVNEQKQAGSYQITWAADNLPGGVYFYQLRAGDYVETKKMVLLK